MLRRFSWNSTTTQRPSTSAGAKGVPFAVELHGVGYKSAIDGMITIWETNLDRLTKSGGCRRVLLPI